jgi:hypothetical protein
MKTNRRTSIDDLEAIGRELADEHLWLAVGGGKGKTIMYGSNVGEATDLPMPDSPTFKL